MSDMKTFTVRDLDRCPREVLLASDEGGGAVIRSRMGRSYLIQPLPPEDSAADPASVAKWVASHRKWLASQSPGSIPAAHFRQVDQLVAGE